MELLRYLRIARRFWWVLVLGLVIGGGSAYGVSRLMTPLYRASATLLVNQTQTPGTIAYNDILTSERLTRTYSELITKRPVLDDVIDTLNLSLSPEELASQIDVGVIEDTQLLQLSVTHEDPRQAQRLANAVARAFIASNDAERLSRPGSVSIVEPAALPTAPVSPRTTTNVLLGSLAGLLLAVVVVFVYEYLDDTVKTPDEVEAAGLATLGGVLRFRHGKAPSSGLVVSAKHKGPASEAYRVLRTNIQFSTLEQPARTLAITSAHPSEGKTTTVANLALALAQTGQRVVVVDADLRRPMLHRVFGLSNQTGLTSAMLAGDTSLGRYLQQPEGYENLWVMTSGPLPPNPSELLGSRRIDTLLESLQRFADVVLFDSSPVLAVADAAILASQVDATVLVVDAGRTRMQALRQAYETLSRSKTRVLGAVLNKLSTRSQGYYYYYYSHYYTTDGGQNGHGARRFPWRRKQRRAVRSESHV